MSEYSASVSQCGTPRCTPPAIVQALSRVHIDDFEALTEARRLLSQGLHVQDEFVNAGGAKALALLLRHESAMIQKKAMKAFLLIAVPAHSKALVACGALDLFLESFAQLKPDSRRKELAGKVLKRLMGCDVILDENTSQASGSHQGVAANKNPVPWFGAPGCLDAVAWELEIVTSLVDGVLMAGSTPAKIRSVAERAVVKLLTMLHHTKKVIVDKHLMDDLVISIRGLSSSSEALMKVATCFTIMHSSNEVTFLRCGGLEALVEVASSDSSGNVGGEMAAWCLYHFAHTSTDNSRTICQLGGVEALVQLLYSPETSARLASAAALLALLKHDLKQDHVKAILVEANAIPALLSALQDVQRTPGEANMAVMVLLVLREISRVPYYKQEIITAGGKDMLQEVTTHSQQDVADLAKRLLKHIAKKSIKESLFKALNIQQKPPKQRTLHTGPAGGNGHVHFDFDLEQEGPALERQNSRLSDKMRGMFKRGPGSVKSETQSAVIPPAYPSSKRFSTPEPQRPRSTAGMLRSRGPASEKGGYAPSLGAYSTASSQRSNKSAILSTNALKQLAKINGPGFDDEDPFPSLRNKFVKNPSALDARSMGSIGTYSRG